MMISRKEYMAGQLTFATHCEYYGQFVTESVKKFVQMAIGKVTILHSHDPHLNDIALSRWDSLQGSILAMVGAKLARANGAGRMNLEGEISKGGGVSLSDTVCVAKEAARQFQEEND